MEKSVEEKVTDIAKNQLDIYGVRYYGKNEAINKEIDNALKAPPSKQGGKGNNYPDIKCLINYKGRYFPIMIEAKGFKWALEKLNTLGEIDNYRKPDQLNFSNISKYAVNGAVHYATAIVNGSDSYKEAVAIGITGWKEGESVRIIIKAYYVSDENYNVPKIIGDFSDFSFLSVDGINDFIDKIDSLYLTEEEKESLTQKLESQIETNLKKLNQEMRDVYSISEAYRVKLISGMIIAGLGVGGQVDPLEIDELRSKEERKSHDGVIIMNKIESFLETKGLPTEKLALIKTNFEQVFIQTDLYKQSLNGESRLKQVYIMVKKDIIPFFIKKKHHLDFTGKLFNVLNEWIKVPDGDQNDVVLTPRYVCDFMVKLCNINKDNYVWDYAAGSGGFLVSAMKQMIKDANQITDRKQREEKINSIKMKQLLGIELRPDMYTLAVLNMILMGDGSTHILCNDSLREYSGKYVQGPEKDDYFPADVFLLNPPYSESGKGFNFVELALSRMHGGYAAVLIQENAGSGSGRPFTRNILDNNTLIAVIKMSDIFCGKSSIQTAIYVFEVGHEHPENKQVKFINFTNDGYTRQSRKKSSQDINLKNTDNAIARYQEVIDIVRDCEPETSYYTIENGLFVLDTIVTKKALAKHQKSLDNIYEKLDPLRKELILKEKERKLLTNDLNHKEQLKEDISKINDIIKNLIDKITIYERELETARKDYDAIYNKIGADWTFGQHRKIEIIPTKNELIKSISNYLSWKISTLLQGDNNMMDSFKEDGSALNEFDTNDGRNVLTINCKLMENDVGVLSQKMNYKKFKIGELFTAQTGDIDIQNKDIDGKGEYFINSGAQNLGIKGRTSRPARIFPAGTITIDFWGFANYRPYPYKMATHNHVFSLSGSILQNENIALYICSHMSYLTKIFSYNNMGTWTTIRDMGIFLPVTKDEKPDCVYMDSYIAAIKKVIMQRLSNFSF